MQMVSEVMTRNVRFVSPQENLQRAAQMMDELNVGALPVCDGERLVGMITDRDITVRATAAGMTPTAARVEEIMTEDVRWCFEDQPLDEVMAQMADTQIRRIPVVSHDAQHKLIGIVALGDLATKTAGSGQAVEETMEKISSPSEPDLSPVGNAGSGNANGNQEQKFSGGSDTGTATGLAGSDAIEAVGHDASPSGIKPLQAGGANAGMPAIKSSDGTAGSMDNTGESGAPGGTDAAGAVGASGGTAGTAGSAGTGVGAKP